MNTIDIKFGTLNKAATKPSFKGHTAYTDDYGERAHKFFQPYNSDRYTAELEFVPLRYDIQNGCWVKNTNTKLQSKTRELPKEGAFIDHDMMLTDSNSNDINSKAVGYRYIFTDRWNPSNKIYTTDQGSLCNLGGGRKYNVLTYTNRPIITRNGLTKQVLPDICMPGYKFDQNGKVVFDKDAYERAYNSVRTHGNKLNGNFAGIIRMLPVWASEGYTKIVGTPFTRDDVSSHLYWTQNVYQISPNLGTVEDFKNLQRELFKHGINWIADGAFVNQGMQGVQFRDVLKHGTDSPFFYWFKASGLRNAPLTLGVIPKNAAEYTRFRLVNAPELMKDVNGKLEFKTNREYDASKPTYVQMYDSRLVTPEELEDTQQLLSAYSKTHTDNAYEITSHDDLTQLVAFPIDYDKFKTHAERAFNKSTEADKSLENPETLKTILNFPNFKIGTKDKGGFDLWDGNMDIAKLNFCLSNSDQRLVDTVPANQRVQEIKNYKRATMQVQDFAIQAGRYWTRLTADTQLEYIAKTLEGINGTANTYMTDITTKIKNKELPQHLGTVINTNILNNALNGDYASQRMEQTENFEYSKRNFVTNEIMNFPLDTIEFGWDLTATLSSPFISKRAINEEQLTLSRYELMQQYEDGEAKLSPKTAETYKKADALLKKEFTELVLSILDIMNGPDKLSIEQKLFDGNEVTPYGRYVIPLIMPDLVKYITVKSFAPQAEVSFKDGQFDYSKADLEGISLTSLHIGGSPEFEAERVLSRYREGILKLTSNSDLKADLAKNFIDRLGKISLENFRVAEAILDKTESGLGWRIDAAKDIANIDALKENKDNPQTTMSKIIKFWSHFNQAVLRENRHAYSTAEITDLGNFIKKDSKGQYKSYIDAETKFIEQTGINNTANYMYYYSRLKNTFAKSEESGNKEGEFGDISYLKNNMDATDNEGKRWTENPGFLFAYPDDSTTYSYTFLGNHDKPRPLHIFALDMGLFHSDLGSPDTVGKITPSGKAVAMAVRINDAMNSAINNIGKDSDRARNKNCLEKAINDLRNGIFKGQRFKPEAFGTRPIDRAIADVIAQAKVHGFDMSAEDEKKLKDTIFEIILKPAMDRFKTAYKMLVTLPGSPTDFIGDKEGATGYETKSNNDFQQNRNFIHYEWINSILNDSNISSDEEKPFIREFYEEMNKIGQLRTRDELSALRNGATVSLKMQENGVYGTFRYNDEGSEVISLYTTSGAQENNNFMMDRHDVSISKIDLNQAKAQEGLAAGLTKGAIYKNADDSDKSTYEVIEENNQYHIVRRDEHNQPAKIIISAKDLNTLVLYKVSQTPYTATKQVDVDFF